MKPYIVDYSYYDDGEKLWDSMCVVADSQDDAERHVYDTYKDNDLEILDCYELK